MAEETEKEKSAGEIAATASETTSSAIAGSSGSDDMIDLEGLVRNIDLTPTDSIVAKKEPGEPSAPAESTEAAAEPVVESRPKGTSAATAPVVAAAVVEEADEVDEPHVEELDPAKLDEILNIEDPEMAAQVEAIRASGFKNGEGDVTLEDDEEARAAVRAPQARLSFRERVHFLILRIGAAARAVKTFAVRSVKDSKGLLRELAVRAKAGAAAKLYNVKASVGEKVAWFKSRNLVQKLSLLVSFAALGLLIMVGAKTIQGNLLPKVERAWIASFSEHADGKFTYDANGTFEDFNDPLLHPEFVILVERIVVNLSRTSQAPESANPMAAFELYLQTDNQDAAVEIKDRNVEIRDAVARSVERMTYPDLADEDGKAKLKLLIRKDLNEIITRGKVRRVFFKTIVLNPE